MDDSAPSPTFLHQQAIKAALEARWDDALNLNEEIIKLDPHNLDACNRLARAYFEKGEMSKAQSYYTQALEIDPYDPIAQKNLKIIKSFKKNGKEDSINHNHKTNGHNGEYRPISPSVFLQEPGKTKIVNLSKIAEPQKISMAYCGMPVQLNIKNRGITILDEQGSYLGVLPDDLAYQLIRLVKGGNQYQAFVKSIKVNGLSILIRETYRSKRFKNQPSFLEQNAAFSTSDIITSFNNMDNEESAEEVEEEPVI